MLLQVNVCAVAKERGIKGFIIDGVIRYLGEIIDMNFPAYAKGVLPVPGGKKIYSELAKPIVCGGVTVQTGEMIIADREGVAVLPQDIAHSIYDKAAKKTKQEVKMNLEEWRKKHQMKIEKALARATIE